MSNCELESGRIQPESACTHHGDQEESSVNLKSVLPSLPDSSPHTSQSAWTYIRCFFWTAISSIFNCGISVFEPPFYRRWRTRESSEPVDLYHRRNQLDQDVDEVVTGSEYLSGNSELSYDLWSVADSSGNVTPPLKSTPDLNYEQLCDTLALGVQNYGSTTSLWSINSFERIDEKLILDLESDSNGEFEVDGSSHRNGILTEPINHLASAFTLIQSYYSESDNGYFDSTTRDHLVKQLLRSVIPRNLSDCSDINISPTLRKMYAWTDPSKDTPSEIIKEKTINTPCELLAYPGKLTMSDSSYSPISPVTAESTTLINDEPHSSRVSCDLNLPDIDRHDQTLAWAMANLTTSCSTVTGTHPTEQINSANNSPQRQSRDKSPAKTINSFSLGDTQSMPIFNGYNLFHYEDPGYSSPDVMIKPKRSSSLKSTRTPPGTPGQKAVRFADAFGLDLTTERHVFDCDNPPKVPASATFDLQLDTDESIAKLGAKQFALCFAQPGATASFIHRVLNEAVCLEDAYVDMPRGLLTGTIRVKSLGYEKRVVVRITYNNWATHCDTQASYVQGSYDGATDRFSFSVCFPDTMVPSDPALFAIRYETHTGEQFWDNNHGRDYKVTCYAKATDLAGDGSWVHYL